MSDDREQAARSEVEAKAKAAKEASRKLGTVGTAAKNAALLAMEESEIHEIPEMREAAPGAAGKLHDNSALPPKVKDGRAWPAPQSRPSPP